MAIQTFTAGQVLEAAQLNTLQKTVATYNSISTTTAALSITSSSASQPVETTIFSGTITAAVGDLIQATWSSYVDTGTNISHFNFYTFNGATAVNPFIAPSTFNPFFYAQTFAGSVSFTGLYKLLAGDIFSNQVTVKLTASTAGNARAVVNAGIRAAFTVTNLGQVQ
jgi:hypothetical protein